VSGGLSVGPDSFDRHGGAGVGQICRKGLLPDPPSQQKIHNKILIFSDPSPGVGVRVTCETTMEPFPRK
jgi:hypothetical protein